MKYRYRALGFLFLLSVITYIDRVCINLLGKDMQKDLGITPSYWGWILGAFALSYAAFEIPTGVMADRTGPRKTAARIVVWWSIFTSLTGVVQNFWQLLSCRFLFGAGEAGAYPTSSAAISRWFPLKERARATGIVWMGSRIGGALSPFIVLTLAETLSWRGTFGVFAVLGAIWVVVWYWWFRDTPKEMPGVTAAELAEIGPPFEKQKHGLPWRVVLRDPNFRTLLLMYHTYCWGSFFYLSWLTDYLREGRGYDNGDLKAIAWLPFACGACGNLFGGWLSDRLCPKIGLKWARCGIGAGGLFLAGVLMMATHFAPGKFLPLVLLALGYGSMDAMLPVAWAVCPDIGRRYGGAVSGAMNMAGQLGSFLSSVAFGYIVQSLRGAGWSKPDAYNLPLLPFSILLLISAALFLRVDPNRQLIPEAPGSDEAEAFGRKAA